MKKIVAAFAILALIFLMLAAGSILAHGATAGRHQNSLGVVISDVNPVITLVGKEISAQYVTAEDGRIGTEFRIHPKATYALFDASITFCGDERDKMTNDGSLLKGWYAFTYKRQAARLIQGVPCYSLVSVDRLEKQ